MLVFGFCVGTQWVPCIPALCAISVYFIIVKNSDEKTGNSYRLLKTHEIKTLSGPHPHATAATCQLIDPNPGDHVLSKRCEPSTYSWIHSLPAEN